MIEPILNVAQFDKDSRREAVFNHIQFVAGRNVAGVGAVRLVTFIIFLEPLMNVFRQPFSNAAAAVVVKKHVDCLALTAAVDVDGDKSLIRRLVAGIQFIDGRSNLVEAGCLVERNSLAGVGYFVAVQFQNGVVANAIVGVPHQHKHRSSLLFKQFRKSDGNVVGVFVFG